MKLDLKEWTEKSLTKDDWDFTQYKKLPTSAISRVYQWEMDRELGSGKGPFGKDAANKKWLATVKKDFEVLPNAPVVSSSGSTFKTGKGGNLGGGGSSSLHVFQINWYCSQQELVDAFAEWLEEQSDAPFTTFPTNTRGRPRTQFTLLEKISIHRFHKVGYSGGPKFFRENAKDAYKANLKRINWTLAQREMNLHLRARTKELARMSKAAGKNWKKVLY
ncbi:MAG TPA: hypothetical protein DGP39_08855 [Verrucomicrobiales bacterium]|jgi:hypothetical protein|nr:hypothetical protein [Verrucomicrobiales bacterium]|tara:strand:+ start:319 stop:975 length:657 start_codon:yes stop_codon:yes gene_type:complete